MSLITSIRNTIENFLKPEVPAFCPNAVCFPARPRSYRKQFFDVISYSLGALAGATLGYALARNFASSLSCFATPLGAVTGFALTYRTLSNWKKEIQQRHNQFHSLVRNVILATNQAMASPPVPPMAPVLAPGFDDRARGG